MLECGCFKIFSGPVLRHPKDEMRSTLLNSNLFFKRKMLDPVSKQDFNVLANGSYLGGYNLFHIFCFEKMFFCFECQFSFNPFVIYLISYFLVPPSMLGNSVSHINKIVVSESLGTVHVKRE